MAIKDTLMKGAISTILPFIPSLTPQLEEYVIQSLDEKPLADGEARAIFSLLKGGDDQAYIVVAYLDAQDKIIRNEEPLKLSDFISNLLKEAK